MQDTREQLIGEDVVTSRPYFIRVEVSALKCLFYLAIYVCTAVTETILKLRRQLHHGELEADYDQNEGQRCVPAQEEAEIFKAVFRITVINPESG